MSADSHLNNNCWKVRQSQTHSAVDSLWSIDAIWRHRSGSILVQVMACCLTAPSHHLNQWLLLLSEVLWHSPDSNFTSAQITILCIEFENYPLKITVEPLWKGQEILTKVAKFGPFPRTIFYKSCLFYPSWQATSFERTPSGVAFIEGFHCTSKSPKTNESKLIGNGKWMISAIFA